MLVKNWKDSLNLEKVANSIFFLTLEARSYNSMMDIPIVLKWSDNTII